ncbi:hypothetical protein BDFB_012296 [Asbolus verrucosus]|uniref:Uncharacterized protein n=1 Tax=Asbolus verrucosus TaxID=1661398 RepID=A0A482VBJ5_ASBVE|nr:hypothetical protein BDFB_012296 [Asbolus verrucosus]
MEDGLILCKLVLKNFGNVFLPTLLVFLLVKTFIFLVRLNPKGEYQKSLRKFAGIIEATGTSHTILKKHLETFPYEVLIYHEILLHNLVPRLNYCEWFLHNMNDDILVVTFFTDEGLVSLRRQSELTKHENLIERKSSCHNVTAHTANDTMTI